MISAELKKETLTNGVVLLRDSYSMKFLCTQVCGIKAFHVWGEEPCLASLEALFPSSRNGP